MGVVDCPTYKWIDKIDDTADQTDARISLITSIHVTSDADILRVVTIAVVRAPLPIALVVVLTMLNMR